MCLALCSLAVFGCAGPIAAGEGAGTPEASPIAANDVGADTDLSGKSGSPLQPFQLKSVKGTP